MKKIFSYALIAAGLFGPVPVLAATSMTVRTLIYVIIDYLNIFLVLLMGFAVVIFVVQVVRYYILPNEDRKTAGMYVMYSVIGFFVILSFWGLVNILQNTFGLSNESNAPATWTSFSNLFPGNGGGGGGDMIFRNPGSDRDAIFNSPEYTGDPAFGH